MRLRVACAVAAVACAAASTAGAARLETESSTNRVSVGDFGSNAPLGCGKGAALAGGFVNEFDWATSKLFLFGFNSTGVAVGSPPNPIPGGPSWRTTVANRGSAASGRGRQTTFAYCRARRAGLRLREAVAPIGPSETATATVTCPRGTEAVSGGFSDQYAGTNGSLVFGFRSKRVGKRGWRASAINLSDSVRSRLIVQANCDPARPGLRQRARTIAVPGGGTKATRIRCGGRRMPWSAGFEGPVEPADGSGAFPYELMRVGRRSWRAAAFGEGRGGDFTVYVLCGKRGW